MIGNTDFDLIMKLASKACLDADVAEFDRLNTQDTRINPQTTQKVKRVLFFKTVQESQAMKVLKKITVACLLVCTILFGAAMSVQPIRAAIVNVVVTWYEKYIGILFVEDEEKEYPSSVFEEIILPPLDECWNMEVILETPALCFYKFTNHDGVEIYYDQQIYKNSEIKIDNTDCEIDEFVLDNGIKIFVCSYADGRNALVWENEYLFSLRSDQMSANQLIEIVSCMYE